MLIIIIKNEMYFHIFDSRRRLLRCFLGRKGLQRHPMITEGDQTCRCFGSKISLVSAQTGETLFRNAIGKKTIITVQCQWKLMPIRSKLGPVYAWICLVKCDLNVPRPPPLVQQCSISGCFNSNIQGEGPWKVPMWAQYTLYLSKRVAG